MSGARHWEQDKEATVYIGNLDERVADSLVWELMLQAGRIAHVHLPKDRVTQTHQGYGFVEFTSEEDADYAAKVMNQVRLFGKPIRVNKASADKQKNVEVGAELFIGNLDPMVDEKTLYDTFSRFGSLVSIPKIARDENNLPKGYGFVSFTDFESSDDAVASMNGQYLVNKEVTVQYAYKKDGKGERHGDPAERMLAAQARKHNVQPAVQPLPPQLFTAPTVGTPGMGTGMAPPGMMNGGVDMRLTQGPPSGFAPPVGYQNGPSPMTAPNHHTPLPHHHQQSHQSQSQQYPSYPPQSNHHYQPHPQTHQHQQQRPSQNPSTPLAPPPTGLPARPPPSQAGYGGPTGFMQSGGPAQSSSTPPPPGFNPPARPLSTGAPGSSGPPGSTAGTGSTAPPPPPPPMGFAGQAPGYAAPGAAPPGFGAAGLAPPGTSLGAPPPGLPPGFQQQAYVRQ